MADELAELIADQAKEMKMGRRAHRQRFTALCGSREVRNASLARTMSIDAPLSTDRPLSELVGDGEWDDPTFDAVCPPEPTIHDRYAQVVTLRYA